ncbi:ATP-binding cassette domain-containing protein [Canibacter sp. lx-72]|uniref:ABC transporter ATP-binding protein n=1 Tax=Canibacter zhuwentaonis TaxID=2837491 RepID=UPI001BDDC3D7|nr:ATP-binding cassette domain-containing protein [Canibacter zhuwentaonis]
MADKPALVVECVSYAYAAERGFLGKTGSARKQVLNEISFAVPHGQITAIVGASGCGKSTLLQIAAGLLQPDSGEVKVGDTSVSGKLGSAAFHPQNDALLPWLRVLDNITLGARLSDVSRETSRKKELSARARGLFAEFGLSPDVEQLYPDQLSGGMRQRVALLRTYLMPQQVLLLDEPFGALDALTRHSLQQWLLRVVVADRRPTVLITHDVSEAMLLADEVLVLGTAPAEIILRISRPPAQRRLAEQAEGADHAAKQQILAALAA